MQLRSRITLAAAFFLLAPVVLFFLIDLMRDRFIASSYVERQYEDDQPFVAGFVREARLRLEAPAVEIAAALLSEQPPQSTLDPDTGDLIYQPWTTMQFRLEQISEKHPGLSFALFDRDGQMLTKVGKDTKPLEQGYNGNNRTAVEGITPNKDAFVVRRTLRTRRGVYVYVGAIPVADFIQTISNSLGEPIALIEREIYDGGERSLTIEQPALNIQPAAVALPEGTETSPNRYEQARTFWNNIQQSALADMPRRYFTIAEGEHRGIVTEIRINALDPSLEKGLFLRLVRDRTLAAIREEKQNRLVYGGFTVLILVSVVLLLWFFNRSFRPLTDLIEALRALARNDFAYAIPHTHRQDELGALARGLTDFRASLVDRERLSSLKEQMEFAAQIQRSILPHAFDVGPYASIKAITEPAEDVGGDFYDVFTLANGNAGIVVADVADKGLGSALFGALASTLVRATARLSQDPGDVLAAVNQQLCERNEADLFVTLFYGVLDRETGTLTYCNAGHEPPLLMHQSARGEGALRIERTPTTKGLPLGLVPEASFESATLQMQPTDDLVLFTDGITEAESKDSSVFTAASLNQVLAGQESTDPAEIIQSVLHDLRAFTGDHPQSDDITLMVVRYDGPKTASTLSKTSAKTTAKTEGRALRVISSNTSS